MSGGDEESERARLRRRIDKALRRAAGAAELVPLLERLLELTAAGSGRAGSGRAGSGRAGSDRAGSDGLTDSDGMADSDEAAFAHRHLAELLIESHPWRAALHLRKLIGLGHADDVAHALMGLSQALLGNFQMAVTAYRRALKLAPRNPWYHHNLGHLLDVALADPSAAREHLRAAHTMEPEEHEITASLAHCLARLGDQAEARVLAAQAVQSAPDNEDHASLLSWIDEGAPEGGGPRRKSRKGEASQDASADTGAARAMGVVQPTDDVLRMLERGMREAGFSARVVERARALWADFHDGRHLRVVKPEVYAAAVEYAIALVHEIDGVTQASVARRYGIAQTSLSSRFGQIRDALALRPGDPRYAVQ